MAEEAVTVFLERSTRATRGKRMTRLLDEEIEQDEQFWNQDALKEEENDTNYEEEAEVADVFDSDFEDQEPEPDDNTENGPEERIKKKKKLIYPGKPAAKRTTKKKDPRKLDGGSVKHEQENPEDADGERSIRKSTRTSVVVRQAEREAIRAALQATTRHPVKRKKGEEKRMTQEEMLLEAAQTEIMNLRNLERVLAREEEVKKKAIVQKEVYSGPQVRFHSRDGRSFLEFTNGMTFSSELNTVATPYPKKAACIVTGLPAKYRDPKTGLPYATVEAFKVIRQRFLLEEEEGRKRKNMDMGLLHSFLGDGFSIKRRRSAVRGPPNKPLGCRIGD